MSAGAAEGAQPQPGAVPAPMPAPTPFPKRLGEAAFTFAMYFVLCATVAVTGFAQSAARPSAPGLAVFLVAVFGLVTIAVEGGAAYPFRELAGKIPLIGKSLYTEKQVWDEKTRQWRAEPDWGLLTCPMCAGMWAGTILAALGLNVFPISAGVAAGMRDLFAHGIMASAWCWIAHVVLSKLGAYSS